MAKVATVDAVQRAVLEDRWQMAMIGLVRFSSDNSIIWGNSKRYLRITETLEDLAALLVEDGIHGVDYDGDEDSVEHLIGDIWDEIKARTLAWAEREPERWERRHAKAVAAGAAS